MFAMGAVVWCQKLADASEFVLQVTVVQKPFTVFGATPALSFENRVSRSVLVQLH